MTHMTRSEPPTATAHRLLVVDFDFFFPNPLDAGAADTQSLRLYDWGRAETVVHREKIWPVRAAVFAGEGVPLPRCQPTTGFWDRFTLATDVLLVADSNAYAGPLAWEGPYEDVVLFDLSVPAQAVSSTSATGSRRLCGPGRPAMSPAARSRHGGPSAVVARILRRSPRRWATPWSCRDARQRSW
jgi:hypothetical protein